MWKKNFNLLTNRNIFIESEEETTPIHTEAIKDDISEDIEEEDDEVVIEDILD